MNSSDVEKISAAIEKFETGSGTTLDNAKEIGKIYEAAVLKMPVATTDVNGAKLLQMLYLT